MKVYIFYPTAPYSGGCLLIAANEKRQARKIAKYLHGDYIDDGQLCRDLAALVGEPRAIINEVYYE